MQAILACLILGICAVFLNVVGFVVLLLKGVSSGIGITKYLENLFFEQPEIAYSILAGEIGLLILWPLTFCYFVHKHDKQLVHLIKQMIVGWIVMLAFMAIISVLILLALYHDGKLGSIATFIMGLLTSPFTMELILCSIGVGLIIVLNYVRLQLSGDEFVEMHIEEE